jgi:hypothetical protein
MAIHPPRIANPGILFYAPGHFVVVYYIIQMYFILYIVLKIKIAILPSSDSLKEKNLPADSTKPPPG